MGTLSSKRSKPRAPSRAKQISAFLAKFDPANAKTIRACRAALRRRLPTAFELIYDNYNFLVFGFCASERPSDCIVSLAAAANGVGLSFYRGASLPDPHKRLQGSGSQNRFVRLPEVSVLSEPAVVALIDAAVRQSPRPLPKSGRGITIIRSVSPKQRPRRVKSAE